MENPGKSYGNHLENYGKHPENYGKPLENYGKPLENYGKPLEKYEKHLENAGQLWKNHRKTIEKPLKTMGKTMEPPGKPWKTPENDATDENYSSMEHSYFEKQKYLTITHQRDVSKSPYLLNDMCRSQLFFETWPFIVCRSLHVANSLANFDFGSPSGSMNCPSRIPTY